ncbi:MAG: hypothetical protein P8X84_05080 [Candidatus Bathyarchaeota archaeon]
MNGNDEKEKIKKIAKLREILEKRVEEMETELDGLKTLLNLIDTTLVQQSFKRAELPKNIQSLTKIEPSKESPIKQGKKGIPLKTVTGDLLAQIYSEKDVVNINLPEDKKFDINTPPFTSFFVERVLTNMHEKDKEDITAGKLDPDKVLSFDIKQEGNIMKEILIKNIRSTRVREIKSSMRWTLEKMYERMKQQK